MVHRLESCLPSPARSLYGHRREGYSSARAARSASGATVLPHQVSQVNACFCIVRYVVGTVKQLSQLIYYIALICTLCGGNRLYRWYLYSLNIRDVKVQFFKLVACIDKPPYRTASETHSPSTGVEHTLKACEMPDTSDTSLGSNRHCLAPYVKLAPYTRGSRGGGRGT